MRVLLRFTIDCDADAAWRALHSPAALAQLYGPFLTMASLDDAPTSLAPGDDAIVSLALGPVPMGTQLIDVSEIERDHRGRRVRILRDSGIPLTGPLSTLDVWDHQMAVSVAPGDPTRTLWRERLVIGGRTAPLVWPTLWGVWQWREARIRALAPTWAHDPAAEQVSAEHASDERTSDGPASG
ncbi:hypothetical protein [Microbacterium sp. KR10-403]|uniref:hypothetical protein n=1 Tax=Microbacterium sp. KR10-403 TaxID=3158581 RepID=UPI0032E42FCF